MDRYKALQLEKELKGKSLNGFEVIEFVNNGKSAAVFKAQKENELFALKIFDNELIERFGHEIQTKRIEQEISIKGHNIANLVKIYDGGNVDLDDEKFYFIIMEFIEGKNLKEYIASEPYDEKIIINILDKLYQTTEQLLIQKQIAHRDIKPENIMINKNGDVILMDLGVLKLIGAKSFSDEEEKAFVGTLRYAPPEFLLRKEIDSNDGWRAINLYQIGAVLHDLIMKKELFSEISPYSNLVIAIKDDMPKISNNNISFGLLQLTRDLMSKDWETRLKLINNERIIKIVQQENSIDTIDSELDELFKKRINYQDRFDNIEKHQRTKQELKERQKNISNSIIPVIDNIFKSICQKGVCKEYNRSNPFLFKSDQNTRLNNIVIQNYLYEIKGELMMGFPRNLYILLHTTVDEKLNTTIDIWGIWPTSFLKPSILRPFDLFENLAKKNQGYNRNYQYEFKTINIFTGIIELDNSLSEFLNKQFIKFLTKALKLVEKIVDDEIKWREEIAKSNERIISRVSTIGSNDIIIDRSL